MGRVVKLEELKNIRKTLREQKKKVVFTNGCFDIIHRGHIDYLLKAKTFGDVLIVGLNTDDSMRRIKGDKRPIVSQDDRAYIVANLTPVDYVCPFAEDTPFEIISSLVPDVLIKGADWNINDIVGKDVVEKSGGKVITIDYVSGQSTTNIIERIIDRFK